MKYRCLSMFEFTARSQFGMAGFAVRVTRKCLSGAFQRHLAAHQRAVRLDGEVDVLRRHVADEEGQAFAAEVTHHAEQRDQALGVLRGDLLGVIHGT